MLLSPFLLLLTAAAVMTLLQASQVFPSLSYQIKVDLGAAEKHVFRKGFMNVPASHEKREEMVKFLPDYLLISFFKAFQSSFNDENAVSRQNVTVVGLKSR